LGDGKLYRLLLCYSEEGEYVWRMERIRSILEKISEKWDIPFSIKEAKDLSEEQAFALENQIRSIPPQARGKIVTSGSGILPLSRHKKLNLKNTPILILYKDDLPVNVYPHQLGTTYFSIEESLNNILERGAKNHLQARGLLEEPIQKIISDNPSLIEKEASFLTLEVDTGAGVADLILKDKEDCIMVVEIETHANDFAIGQASRLARSYASKNNIPEEKLRKLVLCLSYDRNLVDACLGSGIELYLLQTKRIC